MRWEVGLSDHPYQRVHGGIDRSELTRLGVAADQVLDLSVNVNPFGPHRAVVEAVQRAVLADYPDATAHAAREALACVEDVDPERVLVGHGSAELLWAAVSLARGKGPLICVTPTFSEPESAARAWDIPVVHVRTHASDDFVLDPRVLDRAITEQRAAAVYLCQPNNPDGGALAYAALRAVCEAQPRTLFILDQAFLSLSTRHAERTLRFGENVIVVRSLTKDHALPGLRVGYALGAPERMRALDAQRPSWMVSAPAQAAIVAACAHPEHVQHAREFLLDAKATLVEGVRALGIPVVPSLTHFFLAQVGDADALRERMLLRHGVLVRSATSFGLPEHVRIAGCAAKERARVLAALAEESR
jgi:histidinol-phosphate aminotransferase